MEKITVKTALRFLTAIEKERVTLRDYDQDLGSEVYLLDGLRAKLVINKKPVGLKVVWSAYVVHTGKRVKNSKQYLMMRAV